MSQVATTIIGVSHAPSAVTIPRSGPSPATGSTTSRANASHPGGFSRPGAVTSIVAPGHCHRSSRYRNIGVWPTRNNPFGPPMRDPSPPARTARVTSGRSRMRDGKSGGGEIRTHETLAGLPVFKTGAFGRSATPPATASLVDALFAVEGAHRQDSTPPHLSEPRRARARRCDHASHALSVRARPAATTAITYRACRARAVDASFLRHYASTHIRVPGG